MWLSEIKMDVRVWPSPAKSQLCTPPAVWPFTNHFTSLSFVSWRLSSLPEGCCEDSVGHRTPWILEALSFYSQGMKATRKGSLDKRLNPSYPQFPHLPTKCCREGWCEVKWDCGCRQLGWRCSMNVSFPPSLAVGRKPQPHLLGQKAWKKGLRALETAEKEAQSRKRFTGRLWNTWRFAFSHQKVLLNKQQVSSINKACGMQMRFFSSSVFAD